ncbi:hypothetical protein [Rhodoferax fermentans]|uniref:hypothetical protein n=1 Tax=Rhodoferax fermentans TaxID=28066 RepID=UPI00117A41BC|nr:hypothetical protein [Rhodoferax fermentans]
MKHSQIQLAIAAAKRFIKAAEQVERATFSGTSSPAGDYINTGKTSGAARRASLDLTRQLAEMRKP